MRETSLRSSRLVDESVEGLGRGVEEGVVDVLVGLVRAGVQGGFGGEAGHMRSRAARIRAMIAFGP